MLAELECYCVDYVVNEDDIDDIFTRGYLAAQGAKRINDTIVKFDLDLEEVTSTSNSTVGANTSITIAKQCADKFLVFRESGKELVITSFTGMHNPREFCFLESCNRYLSEKVGGLEISQPDTNEGCENI